ncbi:hypothetical protein Unana1_07429 [Umbelopsis nana]
MVKIFTLAIALFAMTITMVTAGPAMDSSFLMARSPVLVGRADPSATNAAATPTASTTATTTKPKKSNFVSTPILETGTLFYVAVAATVALWGTGKSIDYALQRQERYARYLATK